MGLRRCVALLSALLLGLLVTAESIAQPIKMTEALVKMRLRSKMDVFKLEDMPGIDNRRPLTVVTSIGEFAEFLRLRMIPRFEQLTGITVNLITLPDDKLRTTQVKSLRDGASAYDILTVDTTWAKQWATEGFTVPLSRLAAEFEPLGVEAFVDHMAPYYEALKEMLTYRGHLHALPYANFTMGLHYRRDLFEHPVEKANFLEQYGYPLRPPRTLPELLDIAKFFTRNIGDELSGRELEEPFYGVALMAGENQNIKDELSALIWGLGGRWMRPVRFLDGTVRGYEVEVDSRITTNAFQAYVELLSYAPPEATESDWQAAVASFSRGETAMWPFAYNDRWPQAAKVEFEVPGAKIGIAGVPMGRPYTGAHGLAVAYDSLNPQAAYWFLKFIGSYEGQLAYALNGGNVSRRDVVLDPLFSMVQRKHLNGAFAQNHDDMVRWGPQVRTIGQFTSTAVGRIFPELSRTIHAVALGDLTANEGLSDLSEVIHRLQNQHGEAPTLE